MMLYNEKQLECIKHPPSPLMIIAGAGTGKTTTIIARIAHLIKNKKIAPESILALTYTVKAADYLSDSIQKIVGKKSNRIHSSNFHSFAFDQVIQYYTYLGYIDSPTLIEPNESKYIIKQLIDENLYSFKSIDYKKDEKIAFQNIPKLFDRFRDELISEDFLIEKRDILIDDKKRDESSNQLIDCINLFFIYQNYKKENSWIDFGDMIIKFWELLDNDFVLMEIQSIIKHIVVDEYQDNNYALSQIVKKISSHTNSITIVGDDDQSIYSFRGANVIGFSEFRDYFKDKNDYAEIVLDINYRSTQSILNFSDEVVKNNSFRFKNNPLLSNQEFDSDVVLYSGDRDMQLAKVLDVCQKHINEGLSPSNICILTRNGSNAAEIANYLNAFNIRNTHTSGKLFENDTVKDLISFINVIFDDKYFEIGLYRLLSKSKYKETLDSQGLFKDISKRFNSNSIEDNTFRDNDFFKYLYTYRKEIKLDKIVESFIDFSNKFLTMEYDLNATSCISKIVEKYNLIYNHKIPGNICKYINTMFLINDVYIERSIDKANSVSIMTVHQSKGMEFAYVIIPFLSSGSFPSRNYNSPHLDDIPEEWYRNSQLIEIDKIEEERRIFHVASTRAKNKLYLLAPEKGRSKFFKEIEIDSYREETLEEYNLLPSKTSKFHFEYKDKIETKFSATSLSLYESCPLSFKYKKIDRIRIKEKSPASSLGMLIHKILEIIYTTKRISLKEIGNIFDEIWDSSSFDNIYQSNEYRLEAESIIVKYLENNPMNYDIKYLVEEDIAVDYQSNSFIGKIDRIDIMANGDINIIDYKTSKRKKTPAAMKKDIQLGYYSYLLSMYQTDSFNSRIPQSSSLEFVRVPEDPTVSLSFTSNDILEIGERVENIVESVFNNEFTPKKNGLCFFCEYKRLLCPLYK